MKRNGPGFEVEFPPTKFSPSNLRGINFNKIAFCDFTNFSYFEKCSKMRRAKFSPTQPLTQAFLSLCYDAVIDKNIYIISKRQKGLGTRLSPTKFSRELRFPISKFFVSQNAQSKAFFCNLKLKTFCTL